jgi:hypothetical protein
MLPADTNDTNAPAGAPPASTPPEGDQMDATFQLLFNAAESEKAPTNATESKPGMSLQQAVNDPTPPPAADDDAAKAAAKKKADDDAAAATPPPAPVKVRRRERAPEPSPTPTPAPAPTPAPEAKKPEVDEFEAGLLDEEREQLELAKYAEQRDPAKYKGQAAKVTKFLKDHQSYLEKNPAATEPGTDAAEKYQAWLAANNVALPPREARRLEISREAERIADEKIAANRGEVSELHDENFRREQEPKIKQEADQFFTELANSALPEEFTKLAKEKGIEEAKKEFPLEYRVAGEVLTESAADVEEMRKITTINTRTGRPLRAFDPANPQHARILGFIRTQCNAFKNGHPGETAAQRQQRLRFQLNEGKSFLTRDEFYALKPEQRTAHWTFSIDQVVKMSAEAAKVAVKNRIDAERKVRESEGWTRRTAAVAPQTPAPAGSPPAPRPTPIPANGGGTPLADAPDRMFDLLMGEG